MTQQPQPRVLWNPGGVSSLFYLAAIIVFVLGVFGVHIGNAAGPRWTDLGLAFVAAGLLL